MSRVQEIISLLTEIRDLLQKNNKVTRRETTPTNSEVWDSYRMAYEKRYGIAPARNARVNTAVKSLISQLGASDAKEVLAYYLTRNDAFYANGAHAVWICVRDSQKLVTEMKTNRVVTMDTARQAERTTRNNNAIRRYIEGQGLVDDESKEIFGTSFDSSEDVPF